MSTQSTQWIATARMLRRSGFGTTGTVVDSVVAQGDIVSSLTSMLDARFEEDRGALATPAPTFDSALPPEGSSEAKRKAFAKERVAQAREVTDWWIRRMTCVEKPLLEKLTFLWHNHFSTQISVVRSAQLMVTQNETIRKNCLGDFRKLAYMMLTDGAMLRYLDGNSNTSKSPNENLAREFLELFALGHGNGYLEADVRDGARALTGWVVSPAEIIEFDPGRHDKSSKSILGVKGDHDAAAFCDIVLDQPRSSEFIALRLWQQLAADDPPRSETISRLTAAYGPGRDLRALTLAILSDPEFLRGRGTLINGPVDWFIGLLRTLRVPLDNAKLNRDVTKALKPLGQLPFSPPNVGGWPKGQAWLSTTAAALRIRAAKMAARHGDLSSVADAAVGERIESVGYLLGIGSWSSQTVKALTPYRRDPSALVVAAANAPEYLTT